MSGLTLLSRLRGRGITLSVTENGALRIEAPEGTLSPDVREWFRQRKPELIAALTLEQRIRNMAARWEYSPEELAVALAGAASDPATWLAGVAWDEQWTGGSTEPFRVN